jgi:hypothetical protein
MIHIKVAFAAFNVPYCYQPLFLTGLAEAASLSVALAAAAAALTLLLTLHGGTLQMDSPWLSEVCIFLCVFYGI